MTNKNKDDWIKGNTNKIVFVICVVYLANLTFGMDLIPDNIPIAGNLDEILASYVMFRSVGVVK